MFYFKKPVVPVPFCAHVAPLQDPTSFAQTASVQNDPSFWTFFAFQKHESHKKKPEEDSHHTNLNITETTLTACHCNFRLAVAAAVPSCALVLWAIGNQHFIFLQNKRRLRYPDSVSAVFGALLAQGTFQFVWLSWTTQRRRLTEATPRHQSWEIPSSVCLSAWNCVRHLFSHGKHSFLFSLFFRSTKEIRGEHRSSKGCQRILVVVLHYSGRHLRRKFGGILDSGKYQRSFQKFGWTSKTRDVPLRDIVWNCPGWFAQGKGAIYKITHLLLKQLLFSFSWFLESLTIKFSGAFIRALHGRNITWKHECKSKCSRLHEKYTL